MGGGGSFSHTLRGACSLDGFPCSPSSTLPSASASAAPLDDYRPKGRKELVGSAPPGHLKKSGGTPSPHAPASMGEPPLHPWRAATVRGGNARVWTMRSSRAAGETRRRRAPIFQGSLTR